MITAQQMNDLVETIRDKFAPKKIVLFGSYAYGSPRPNSDIDLLVVMSYEGGGIRQEVRIVQTVMPPFGVDIVVRRPDELKQRIADGDFFLREITSKGKVLYNAAAQEWVDKAEGDFTTA